MTNSHSKNSSEDSEVKKPDYIIIDDTSEHIYNESNGSSNFGFEDVRKIQRSHHPLTLRILFGIGMVLGLVFAAVVLVYIAFVFALSLIFLFQNQRLNAKLQWFWKLFTHALVISLGLAIGIFSPLLGIGLIVLYFSLKGEKQEKDWLKTNMNRFF